MSYYTEWVRCLTPGFAALILAIGLGGCGQESSNMPAASDTGTRTTATTARSVDTRDLKTFDVCARVPTADVAIILDSIPEQTSATATMTTYSSDCTYTVQRDESTRNYAIVFVYAPEWWDPSAAGNIEKIDGLGDEAYLEDESQGSSTTIKVLVKGDMMIDVRAESPEQARKLTLLALRRLTGAER